MSVLEGRVAFITGASRGIGSSVARALSEHGVRLGLASRTGVDLGLATAVAAACDVRDRAQIESLAGTTASEFGGLDIVVANAGVGAYGSFIDLSQEHLEEMVDTNVKGTLYTVRATLPYLMQSDAADLIIVASEAGRRAPPLRALQFDAVCPGQPYAGARPRAARAGYPLYQRLSWWGRYHFRDGRWTGTNSGHARAPTNDAR